MSHLLTVLITGTPHIRSSVKLITRHCSRVHADRHHQRFHGTHAWTGISSSDVGFCPIVWAPRTSQWVTIRRHHAIQLPSWSLDAVQNYLDGKPLIEVLTVQSYADILRLLPPGRQRVLLIDKQGKPLTDRAVTSLRYKNGEGVQLPVDLFIVHEAAIDRELPKEIRIDCTGLVGHDLGGEEPWHICFRSDRHGQSIYGPSLAAMETTAHDRRKRPVHTVALGLTKAMHEFLTLHYFATDSASSWDTFLTELMPNGTWPGADERRQCALDMFAKSHIAPSYRRLPHPTWTTCISLLLDLLLGAGKARYLCTRPTTRHQREVFVRGFSAGSYSGICLLHLLWKLPYVDVRGKLGGIEHCLRSWAIKSDSLA